MAISQATTGDLTSRSLRPLTTAETTWATVRLRDAFTQILTTVPGAAARLDAGVVSDPFNQLVIQTQVGMVLRVLSNPDGVLEETIDDYTRRLDASISTGGLYMSAAEQALLVNGLSSTRTSRGAFTIVPARPPRSFAGRSW